ncbi:MAG: DUF3127 domain-containing protein [Salinivirgaceae bacterium]|jgi:hypothetical protein|nr:DUF3127 domain-containing protein [Salinivirgaceae bacterium]
MEITGKIIEILPAQTGSSSRGEWKRQDFIIETQDQYPKKVCVENFNDKVDLGMFSVGATVTVSINIESREYNGKWYTGVKAWKASVGGSTSGSGSTESANNATPPPVGDVPPPSEEVGSDDLPF